MLFTTTGNAGHLLPLVPLARACLRAGHDVRIATQRSRGHDVQATGLPLHAFDDPPHEAWAPIMAAAAQLDVEQTNARIVGELFARMDSRAALPGVLDIVEAWRPAVIVRETYEFAGGLAAELHGIPHVRVGLGLARTEEWAIDLARPALSDLRTELGLPNDPEAERIRTSPYLTPVPAALEDPAAPCPRQAVRFRGVEPGVAAPLPHWWPDNDLPLVYVTFGSMAGDLGFFPRLYQAAIDALAPLPVRILVTTGHGGEPDELGDLPRNVHVERWVAQKHILSQAAAVVCHGGFGTTLGALAAGVPPVILPLFATDQWQLGHRVAQIGAGIALPEHPEPGRRAIDDPSPEVMDALPAALRQVIEEPAHLRAAAAVADDISALPSVDTAVDLLAAVSTRGGARASRTS